MSPEIDSNDTRFTTPMEKASANIRMKKPDDEGEVLKMPSDERSPVKHSNNDNAEIEEMDVVVVPAARKQRDRRNQIFIETITEPMSPASSSATSQNNSSDTTFEPTIDMMVNDFDDEQTLNEEEVLAALEQQDPQDEIATLKEESEMPLEVLLAKYRSLPDIELPQPPPRKISRKGGSGGKRMKHRKEANHKKKQDVSSEETIEKEDKEIVEASDVILIESGDEENINVNVKVAPTADKIDIEADGEVDVHNGEKNEDRERSTTPVEKLKSHRSHLLDLYPEESFISVLGNSEQNDAVIALETLYGDDEEDEDDEVEDEEADSDYVKKTIMVGGDFQAVIPDGLSQYGDVLPYENEDKLIWEPSQVSEREVEEYLLKARDIKPTLSDDAAVETDSLRDEYSNNEIGGLIQNVTTGLDRDDANLSKSMKDNNKSTTVNSDSDVGGVVKDNEQALHLLVQCGYDFKEALRRKRLNALPLTGQMSLWSEEECRKFEEGIQKFGKDFLKIRQNEVRTRTMRELVQFYYLWKKSERRDHDFANSDTVDHMDIYLNEGGDYGHNTATAGCSTGQSSGASNIAGARRNGSNAQKNFSIMTGGSSVSTGVSSTTLTTTITTATTPSSTTTSHLHTNAVHTKTADKKRRSVALPTTPPNASPTIDNANSVTVQGLCGVTNCK